MHFVIADNQGNVLDTFSDGETARSALRMMVLTALASDDVFLLAYEDDGSPAGDAMTFNDITATVTMTPSVIPFLTESYPGGTATGVYTRRVE